MVKMMTEKEWKEVEKKWDNIFHDRENEENKTFTVFAAETKKIIERN